MVRADLSIHSWVQSMGLGKPVVPDESEENVRAGEMKTEMGVRTKADKRLMEILLERLVVWIWLRA